MNGDVRREGRRQRAAVFDVGGTLYICPEFDSKVDKQAEELLAKKLQIGGKEAKELLAKTRKENTERLGDNSKVFALESYGISRANFHQAVSLLDPAPYLVKQRPITGLLEGLKQADIKLGLLSNFQRRLVDKILHELGSSIDSFDATICEDDGLPIKPNPAPFQEIAKRLNVPIPDVWFVGDSVSKDIMPAKRVGMKTILVEPSSTDGDPAEADYRVRTAADVVEIIAKD